MSKENEFIKAPWKWWDAKSGRPKNYDLAGLLAANGERILTLYGGNGEDALGKSAKKRAMARLIVNAPQLLKALQDIVNVDPYESCKATAIAKAALSRVESRKERG